VIRHSKASSEERRTHSSWNKKHSSQSVSQSRHYLPRFTSRICFVTLQLDAYIITRSWKKQNVNDILEQAELEFTALLVSV
jgi:hypothetical protein